MAAISALITELRTDLSDDLVSGQATRFSDTQLLNLFKKAIRRANRIVQRNGIQFAKKKVALNTVANQDYIDISSSVPDFDVWHGLYQDSTHKEIPKKTEREWETIFSASGLANCLLDQANSKIYFNGTPSAVVALTLWYFPSYDIASYTTASSTPWNGRLDDIIMEYCGIRAKNIDEMSVSFDQQLLQDLELQILNSYSSNAPTVVEGQGWLP
jgi:hypothetical protein